MRTLTFAEVTALRRLPARSALLLVTDRCPVGCAHCSVDARRGGPSIRDWPLFADLVAALARLPGLTVVGLSGGEPFAERRGLLHAVERLTEAGKLIVPYTSGYWAVSGTAAAWIRAVISRSSCIVLSTDRFHADRVPERAFIAAARAIAAAGVPIACQVLSDPDELHAATSLLTRALGPDWREQAEIVPVPLLAVGRAARFAPPPQPAPRLGRCVLARSPVVRYDGRVTACCNETVVMGGGPTHLHRQAAGDDLPGVLGDLAGDSYLTAISSVGADSLAALPGYDSAGRERDLCRACWRLLTLGAAADPRTGLLALLGQQRGGQGQ